MIRIIFKLLLAFYCTAILSKNAAIPVKAAIVFEDTFNSDSLSQWHTVRSIHWTLPSLPCRNGEVPAEWMIVLQQLGIQINDGGCVTEIIPNSFSLNGISEYTFSFDLTLPQTAQMDRNYLLKWKDPSNYYGLKLLGDTIAVEKIINDQQYFIPGMWSRFRFFAEVQYHIKNIVTADGRVQIYVNGTKVIDFQDESPTFHDGTIGFRASVGSINRSIVWFDNVRVENEENRNLSIPPILQNDEEWKLEEYDTAIRWTDADITIERWGCALTSAVAVLNYYNIYYLLGGQKITPLILNNWLNEQSDGYVGNGNLNWLAVSRLSKINQQHAPEAPALEFSRHGFNLDVLKAKLQLEQPVILELPGHFVVAHSYEESDQSIGIHDPLDLSHTSLHIGTDAILSMRLFTPSHTDLSAFLFVENPNVEIQFDGIEKYAEHYTETRAHFAQVLKPEDKTHYFTLKRKSGNENENIPLFIYLQDGSFQIEEVSLFEGEELKRYALAYTKTHGGTLEIDMSTQTPEFEQLILDAWDRGEILSGLWRDILIQIARDLEKSNENRDAKQRYFKLITQSLTTFVEIDIDFATILPHTP